MPRVLKAAEVFIDEDNTVQIKSALNLPQVSEAVEEEGPSPEEALQDMVMNAKRESELILKRARAESDGVLAAAKSEAEAIVAEAQARMAAESQRLYEEKRQEGYDQGINEAMAQGNAIKAEAQSVLDAGYREVEEAKSAVEPEAVNLIINIIEKLLGDAIRVNPAVVVSLIRQGFAGSTAASQGGHITIRVSDTDYPEVTANKEEITALAGGLAEIEIVRDLSLGPTDCVIDTPFGGIDVSLAPQFEALKENLIFLLEHRI